MAAKKKRKSVKKKSLRSSRSWGITSEAALTAHLGEDLTEAWLKLRTLADQLGDQRIYASGRAIMFSKKYCYAFVRPRVTYLEVVIFLGSGKLRPSFRKVQKISQSKYAHTFKLTHSDQIEGPLEEALIEAFARETEALPG